MVAHNVCKKGGSIIPMGPDMAYIDEKPLVKVDIHAYSGRKGFFTLYEDDGLTYDYEKGKIIKQIEIKNGEFSGLG
jgi:alpha-glucosidase (family GH31 glycosyl hydrolase)